MAECLTASVEALQFIEFMKKTHGPILFYQSSGCCDGSAPMCYLEGDFRIGDADVCLGEAGGVPFYMHKSQYEYWKHTKLILDTAEGPGPAFSLDSLENKHFITSFIIKK